MAIFDNVQRSRLAYKDNLNPYNSQHLEGAMLPLCSSGIDIDITLPIGKKSLQIFILCLGIIFPAFMLSTEIEPENSRFWLLKIIMKSASPEI